MMDDKARDAIAMWDRLDGERGTFKSHWQQCANYILPNRADYIVQHSPGQKRMQWVYEGTAVWACEQFAAGLHSMLTSPTLRWFSMRAGDDKLNNIDRVQAWLDDTSERMYGVFNGPKHNFASQSTELYMDIGSIGTSVMYVGSGSSNNILFSTRHLRECCLAESDEDRIDTCVRKWQFTAKQASQRWGDAAGEAVAKAMGADKYDQKMDFIHMVKPRRVRDPQRADRQNKAFESTYVSVADGTVIDEGGFDEFPYLCPRLSKVSGEIYGRSPGMSTLPDIKMLNEMMKLVVKSAQKIIDPPLQIPDDGFLLPVRTTPGSLNSYRAGSKDRIEALQTHGDPQLGIEMINALRQQIIRGFYVEWMLMPSDPRDPAAAGKGVTATYVLQQRDEKMRLLSPMLARLQSEFLGPLIDRVFAMMWRQSMALRFGPGSWLSPPPPELSGVPLRVEYVSPIAVAQKTSQLDVVGRLIQTQQQLLQLAPNEPIVLDIEAIMRLTGRDLNAPAMVLKTPDQMDQVRQQAAQAAQQQQQHAALANMAGAAKDGGAAMQSITAAMQSAGQTQQGGGQGNPQPAAA